MDDSCSGVASIHMNDLGLGFKFLGSPPPSYCGHFWGIDEVGGNFDSQIKILKPLNIFNSYSSESGII